MSLSETAPEPQDQLGDPETGGTLIIDLNAVEENFRALTRLLLHIRMRRGGQSQRLWTWS